ncbi:hypothetical protein [Cellvibrio sp. QJXJ]|uniref:hypothetical protein n=1 Tax=Cellvibrio sp. QJXJ TaxID=2964606 RepID=UPI0021C3A9F3|nr:hypothetical protein [Cellvibrio sp. QJXJ]UUA74211.1 hypothetical protein NNX04_07165 [Cellvibrio sp. QJXJ]
MKIKDWDIWHVYSSFLDVTNLSLHNIAYKAVKSKLAVCALHRDGETWWQTNQGVKVGFTKIEMNSQSTGACIKKEMQLNEGEELDAYTLEAWYQASYFRFSEMKLCNEEANSPEYIRLVLSEFHLTSKEYEIGVVLYPVIKLYENGIVLVQFRSISNGKNTLINDFINRYVNLSQIPFDDIKVGPAIAQLAAPAYHHALYKFNFISRIRILFSEKLHNQTVLKMVETIKSGDFSASLCSLPRQDGFKETLSTVAKSIFSILAFLASNPRNGLAYVLFGQRKIIGVGNFWNGRPHIYLLTFYGQKNTSRENINAYGDKFGSIIGRHAAIGADASIKYLPKDVRPFDDYSALIAKTGTLWVWSKNGKKQQKIQADANRGHLIYEQQVTVEMLEYGYMLHRALLSKVDKISEVKEAYELRWSINNLKISIYEQTNFGEIQELLRFGWNEFGINDLHGNISEALSIRSEQASLREETLNEKNNRWLTILFGVITVPSLAEDVLEPAWSLLGWWNPVSDSGKTLFFIGISFVVVVLGLVAIPRLWRAGH